MVTVDTTPKKILDKLGTGITAAQSDPLNLKTVAYTGYEGGNLHLLNTDATGDLQVDVKTMPTTTVQATDLDIRDLTATERTPLGSQGVALQQVATTNELKVREQGTVTVSATDLDIRNLAAAQDAVVAYTGNDGTNTQLLATDASRHLQVDVLTNPSQVVTATDLDIRDLTATERTPLGSNGVALQQQATTNELKVREQGTVTVQATNLDVRDLTSASDSVEVKQATASNLKAQVQNIAGTGLTNLGYGSSDGGMTWYPIKVDASGILSIA